MEIGNIIELKDIEFNVINNSLFSRIKEAIRVIRNKVSVAAGSVPVTSSVVYKIGNNIETHTTIIEFNMDTNKIKASNRLYISSKNKKEVLHASIYDRKLSRSEIDNINNQFSKLK